MVSTSDSSFHYWIFERVTGSTFGDFGFAGGGAAGYELDRADPALGTPENAVCIARSQDHGPGFELVHEDRLWPGHTTTGERAETMIRADMILFETSEGGLVFSTGSITYTGSLPWNDYDNSISTLTANVLNRFMQQDASRNRGSSRSEESMHGQRKSEPRSIRDMV